MRCINGWHTAQDIQAKDNPNRSIYPKLRLVLYSGLKARRDLWNAARLEIWPNFDFGMLIFDLPVWLLHGDSADAETGQFGSQDRLAPWDQEETKGSALVIAATDGDGVYGFWILDLRNWRFNPFLIFDW